MAAGALALGVGAAVAQDGDQFYPPSPAATETETDGTDVLPANQQRPADAAPDATAVQADALSATGFDTAVWAVAGVGILVAGGVLLRTSRRRAGKAS